MLQKYIDSGEESFRIWARNEAEELAQSALGGTLLATIGNVYSEHARVEIGGYDYIDASMSQATRAMSTRYNIVSAGITAAVNARSMHKLEKKEQAELEKSAKKAQEMQDAKEAKEAGVGVGVGLEKDSTVPSNTAASAGSGKKIEEEAAATSASSSKLEGEKLKIQENLAGSM